ncbi:acyltransferase family protein [Klebsiella aerogenes]|uniref:acyltransferase family protein n=1 Tax=Klebsiella aerogenes TaxID=548 RepID=UPI002278BFF4|nr:acyltransferase family protein [Klebsiella aerogenes]MCY4763244.1 acyltransferase family protein [Klebsiella aerogenes]
MLILISVISKVAFIVVRERDLSFDSVKGVLIILVIIGHILPGSDSEGVRGLIYYFHMPLFLAVTGYFIKTKALEVKWSELLNRYKFRMILPYVVAFIVYTLCHCLFSIGIENLELKDVIWIILHPYYHLWYIPAVLIFIAYTKIIKGNIIAVYIIFALSSIISILWHGADNLVDNLFPSVKYLGDKRFYNYYSFFLLGYIIGSINVTVKWYISVIICLLMVFINRMVAFSPSMGAVNWYIFNVFLIFFVIALCQHKYFLVNRFLVSLGQTSLPVYLWHVGGIFLAGEIMNNSSVAYYVMALFFVLMLIWISISQRGKYPLLNKYFYGEPSKAK